MAQDPTPNTPPPDAPLLAPDDLRDALEALGAVCREPTTLVLAGGSALALTGLRVRTTHDGDVIVARPSFGAVERAVSVVAHDRDLAPRWLNDAAAQFARFLPADYEARLVPVGTYGSLTVSALGRLDLILLKVLALRPQDAADLDALAPTVAEWHQVMTQFTRIATGSRTDAQRTVKANRYIVEDVRRAAAGTRPAGTPSASPAVANPTPRRAVAEPAAGAPRSEAPASDSAESPAAVPDPPRPPDA